MSDTPTLDEIIGTLMEVRWSVAFEQLQHEKLTDHGRWVLTHAPDVLRALTTDRTALATLRAAVREYFTAEDAWHGLVCADADADTLAVASRRCTIAADLARALTADHEEGGT